MHYQLCTVERREWLRSASWPSVVRVKRLTLLGASLWACWGLLGGALACQPSSGGKPVERPAARTTRAGPTRAFELSADSASARLPAQLTRLLSLPGGTLGPRALARDQGQVLVWASPHPAGSEWQSAVWRTDGTVSEVTTLDQQSGVVLRLELAPQPDGGLIASSVRSFEGAQWLDAASLDAAGTLKTRWAVHSVAGEILWARTIAVQGVVLSFWAEQSDGFAELFCRRLSEGAPQTATLLARTARSWQLANGTDSAFVATVEGTEPRALLRSVDSNCAAGPALALSPSNLQGGLDLDMAVVGDSVAVAWSQRLGSEDRVVMARSQGAAKLTHPARPLATPSGNQSLSHLLPAAGDAGFVSALWEDLDAAHGAIRRHQVASFSDDGTATSALTIRSYGDDPRLPVFAQLDKQFALLSQTVACPAPEDCNPDRWIRTGTLLHPQRPARSIDLSGLGGGGGPTLLWDLSCTATECRALASDDAHPPTVYGLILDAAGSLPGPEEPRLYPRMWGREALGPVPELVAIRAAEGSTEGSLLGAWLSYFDPQKPYRAPTQPAPDGRLAPVRAQLVSFDLGASWLEGAPLAPSVISYRARSWGGLSLVPPEAGEGLLVWAALDNQRPEVFATLINGAGKRLRQKMLTHERDEVSNVVAARVPAGYLIAWMQQQAQTAIVRGLLVDRWLRATPVFRLSRGAAELSDLTLRVIDGTAWLAWAESDSAEQDSTIWGSRWDTTGGQPASEPKPWTEGQGLQFMPRLLPAGRAAPVMTWLERQQASSGPTSGLPRSAGELMWSHLDAEGPAQGQPVAGAQSAEDYTAQCAAGACNAVMVQATGGGLELLAARWDLSTAKGDSALLAPLRGTVAAAVVPQLLGNDLLFADVSATDSSQFLLHRARVRWHPEGNQ